MNRSTATTWVMVAAVGMGWGCGHEAGNSKHRTSARPLGSASESGSDQPSPEMQVRNELGVIETADVEAVLEGHFDEIRGCYQRAGKAQRYAGGKVTLRFRVGGGGQAEDVLVVESNLGNYGVERCLVGVGRRITFKAPEGNRATTFDYPVEFRSTQELAVLDVNDGAKIERDISGLLPRLAACGRLATDDVTAIMYIEPSGFPGSVGLSAATNLDEAVAGCIIQTIRRSHMTASLPGHVLRCNFSIPPLLASAEPPSRRAASNGVGRRRRR
ncbi:MAG TPA: TonB family protein [Polyangia bacterium]|nr:TonB family protein [Polyangia bacterium]